MFEDWLPRLTRVPDRLPRIALCLFVLLLLTLLSPIPVSSQERPDTNTVTVTGVIADMSTAEPLENAVIRVPELEINLLTDSLGQFRLEDVRPGTYEMTIRCLGYRTQEGDFEIRQAGSFRVPLWPIVVDMEREPGRIMGRVLEAETGEPLHNADVHLVDMGVRTSTNRWGWFELPETPPGVHALRTSFLGRETREDSVIVENKRLMEVEVHLAVEPIPIEGITVTAYPRYLVSSGFFRRRAKAYEGKQWTREELEEQDPVFLQDLLTTVPGIRSMGVDGLYGRSRCKLAIFVDDMRMYDWSLDFIEPRNVEALEVWHGTLKPPEFFWYCGVVQVWLKH